jgi:glycosyltransferase involved in cell wall biosynthesis
LLYFYAISRWLYEREPYVRGRGPVARAGLAVLSGPLRRWDQRTVRSAQRFVTESTVMRDTLRSIYEIEADVVPLPAVLDPDGSMRPVANLDDGFLLCAARLVPYKNVDVVVRAMADLPDEHLVVAGDGPDRAALEAIAGTNVTFLGTCDDDRLRWLYAHCGAVVSAALEPFGLTPVEGARFGKPTVALDAGGFKDTVLPGVTGLRFAQAEPAAVVASVREFRDMQFDAARIDEELALS